MLGHPECVVATFVHALEAMADQLGQRGSTLELIDEAIAIGRRYPAPNYVNRGNTATRYVCPRTRQVGLLRLVVDSLLRKGYRFKGTAAILSEGPQFDEIIEFNRRRGSTTVKHHHIQTRRSPMSCGLEARTNTSCFP
jgi:hypothetical protein